MLVNLMQVITVIVNIYIAFTEKKKRIYIATFFLNLSQLLMYFFNKDLTTAIVYIAIVLRSLVYIYKDKIRKKTDIVPFGFIAIQIGIGIFTIQNPAQLISIIIPCYTCYYLWFYEDTQELRIGNIIINSAWGFYNLYCGLYIVLIMRIITVISNIIGYIKKNIRIVVKQEVV